MQGQEKGEETTDNAATAQHAEAADAEPEITGGSEPKDSVTGDPDPAAASEKER